MWLDKKLKSKKTLRVKHRVQLIGRRKAIKKNIDFLIYLFSIQAPNLKTFYAP